MRVTALTFPDRPGRILRPRPGPPQHARHTNRPAPTPHSASGHSTAPPNLRSEDFDAPAVVHAELKASNAFGEATERSLTSLRRA